MSHSRCPAEAGQHQQQIGRQGQAAASGAGQHSSRQEEVASGAGTGRVSGLVLGGQCKGTRRNFPHQPACLPGEDGDGCVPPGRRAPASPTQLGLVSETNRPHVC